MSKNIYTVTNINTYIEHMFSDDMLLENLSISGEVSNCKYNHTGHIYFTLKDEHSAISCVMFSRSRAAGLDFQMKDGDQVVVAGYVGVYAAAGRYQLYARKIELNGVGDLYRRFEELKKELEESGMFSEIYKKAIPSHVKRLGVITAPTGAAVHDIITVSKRRNPFIEIFLYPAQVQGEGAAASIVSGINCLDAMDLDCIILGRGGGSIEDLWAFNEEAVARAIFNCNTPTISAVGHETDFTIADFVADKRAATPSQAAEIANFVYDDFAASLMRYADKMDQLLDLKMSAYTEKIKLYSARLLALRPDNKLKENEEKLSALRVKLDSLINNKLINYESRLAAISGRLDGLSPAKKIASGFAYITDSSNKKIESVEDIKAGDKILMRISDGRIESEVIKVLKE